MMRRSFSRFVCCNSNNNNNGMVRLLHRVQSRHSGKTVATALATTMLSSSSSSSSATTESSRRCRSCSSSSSFSSFAPTTATTAAVALLTQRRHVTTYGDRLLSHPEIVEKYAITDETERKKLFESPDLLATEILPALEAVERQMMHWKRNRWEFRIPRLLSSSDLYVANTLLSRIKSEILSRQSLQKQVDTDLDALCALLNIASGEEVREKGREWISEKVSTLRWEGETQAARQVREAWLRVEKVGRRDYQLLERLCCGYAMAVLGTFDDAFSNQILPDAATGEPQFTGFDRKRNPFVKLVQRIHTCFPGIDVLFGLMGYAAVPAGSNNVPSEHDGHFGSNGLMGYRGCVGKYLAQALADRAEAVDGKKQSAGGSGGGRLLHQRSSSSALTLSPSTFHVGNPGSSKVLFASSRAAAAAASSSSSDSSSPSSCSSCDVLLLDVASFGAARSTGSAAATGTNNPYLNDSSSSSSSGADNNNTLAGVSYCLIQDGRDITLISISSDNKFKRSTQLPPLSQLEAIARRTAMVFGLPMEDNVRVRNLLLPPHFLDAASLHRLNKACLDGHVPRELKHWVEVYDKQLEGTEDEDYAEDAAAGGNRRQKQFADEWVTL